MSEWLNASLSMPIAYPEAVVRERLQVADLRPSRTTGASVGVRLCPQHTRRFTPPI